MLVDHLKPLRHLQVRQVQRLGLGDDRLLGPLVVGLLG